MVYQDYIARKWFIFPFISSSQMFSPLRFSLRLSFAVRRSSRCWILRQVRCDGKIGARTSIKPLKSYFPVSARTLSWRLTTLHFGFCFKVSALRPVYTGDFCRCNPMQFLSRQNCIKFQTCSKPLRYRGEKSQLKSQLVYTCDFKVATWARQKLHRVAATKIACVNGSLCW